MPSYRKLPSGLWQAVVYRPDGRRTTKTDKLKGVVKEWAEDLENRYRRGERHDPRAGEILVADWRKRAMSARGLEMPTLQKSASIWRTHCEPAWGDWPLKAVTRAEAQAWANKLRTTRRARRAAGEDEAPFLSAATVHEAVHAMSSLYLLALNEDPPVVTSNPFARLELPKIEPRIVEFYEHAEAGALYTAIEKHEGPRGGRRWRLMVELGMDIGLRPGELYGLHVDRVDWDRGLVHVHRVMTRFGLREYPKSKKSRRSVPIPESTLKALGDELGMARRWAGRCSCPKVMPDGTTKPGAGPCNGLVFSSHEGGPVDDGRFRTRVWYPAIERAGVREFPPRIMRHTAASWLVMDGVPLYDVQHLLGHESFTTTQRYAHLAPDHHDKVRASWERRKGS
ncbi:hypothetical protein GCM10010182_67070 [Actinomadura cremea]|nr:hypothetical protein GCM10010182_67070 [Actinomadura cremea]